MESKVIVINHGSHTLRIGLASDPIPKIIPNLIARRKKVITQNNVNGNINKIEPEAFKGQLLAIKNAVKEFILSQNKGYIPRPKPPPTDNVVYNQSNCMVKTEKKKKPKNIPNQTQQQQQPQQNGNNNNNGDGLTTLEKLQQQLQPKQRPSIQDSNYLIGEDAVQVSRDFDKWVCYSPVRMGTFNIDNKNSLRRICDELVEMWVYAIEWHLGITPSDLGIYGCVCVAPDYFEQRELKEVTRMLLNEITFTSLLLAQESVCTSFGTAMSTQCCLIDIGHEKTQISCIDEGYLLPNSKVTLRYGADSLRKLLQFLLLEHTPHHTHYFPSNIFPHPHSPNFTAYYTRIFEQIRNNYVTFQQLDDMDQQKVSQFKVDDPNKDNQVLVYRFNVNEIYQLVAMSLFFPQILLATQGDPQPQPILSQQELLRDNEDITLEDQEYFIPLSTSQSQQPTDRYSNIPLDHAIHRCIMSLNDVRIDTKKKYFNNILIVGGGSLVPGLQEVLKQRLMSVIEKNAIPPTSSATTTVLLPSDVGYTQNIRNDIDTIQLPWKGGAIIGCLESSKEMWITREEYKTKNSSILKEKLPW